MKRRKDFCFGHFVEGVHSSLLDTVGLAHPPSIIVPSETLHHSQLNSIRLKSFAEGGTAVNPRQDLIPLDWRLTASGLDGILTKPAADIHVSPVGRNLIVLFALAGRAALGLIEHFP